MAKICIFCHLLRFQFLNIFIDLKIAIDFKSEGCLWHWKNCVKIPASSSITIPHVLASMFLMMDEIIP